jgi:hypothetical protein
MYDTTNLTYSFGRGALSQPVQGIPSWAFDEMVTKLYDAGTSQFNNDAFEAQVFDGNSRLVTSYTGTWVAGVWDTTNRMTREYTNNDVTTLYSDTKTTGTWEPGVKTVFTYSNDGILTQLAQCWDDVQNIYQDDYLNTNTYVSGNVTENYTQHWDGTAWQPYSRVTYTYSGNNVTSFISESYMSGVWLQTQKVEYDYNTDNDMIEQRGYIWNTGAWQLMDKRVYTHDNNHNILTQEYYMWNSGLNDFTGAWRAEYQYNSSNLVEISTMKTLWTNNQFGLGTNDPKRFFYFEQYDPASAGTITRQNTPVSIFPNPANGTIYIKLQSVQTQAFGVTIFDATGKAVRHWNEAPTTLYQKQVNVEDLPAGNYFLRIDNRPQEAVPFTILK